MRRKEFDKRIGQFDILVRHAQKEMDGERTLEVQQLMQDELMPRFHAILKELAPSIEAWQAYQNALEGSMKPLTMESKAGE